MYHDPIEESSQQRFGHFASGLIIFLLPFVGACSSGGSASDAGDATLQDMGDTTQDTDGNGGFFVEGYGEPDDGLSCSNAASGEHVSSNVYKDLSADVRFSCGVTESSQAECWGNGGLAASPPSGTFVKIYASERYSCGLGNRGKPTCWGTDYEGSGGAKTPSDARFYSLGLSRKMACGLIKPDGKIECWWSDASIADGVTDPPFSLEERVPDGEFARIGGGRAYMCAIRKETDGSSNIECWGTDEDEPAEAPSGRYVDLAVGDFHACAADSDDIWKCWGTSDDHDAPDMSFTDVSVGADICGLTGRGELNCWGERGPANQAFYDNKPSGCFEEATIGSGYGCGIRGDGRVECWGENVGGRLDVP